MVVRVDAHGYGSSTGSHLSVYVLLPRGKYDSEVKWPLLGSVTVSLLNQLEDNNHHERKFTLNSAQDTREEGTAYRGPQFIHHSELDYNPDKNTLYLKDDTLYFRVAVEVADYKPWLEPTI